MTKERMDELAEEIVTIKDGIVTIDGEGMKKSYEEILREELNAPEGALPSFYSDYIEDWLSQFIKDYGAKI